MLNGGLGGVSIQARFTADLVTKMVSFKADVGEEQDWHIANKRKTVVRLKNTKICFIISLPHHLFTS